MYMFIIGIIVGVLTTIGAIEVISYFTVAEEEKQEEEFLKLYKERYPDRPLPKKI
jgi:hypothetical protein